MIKFKEKMREKEEVLKDLKEGVPVGREHIFRLCMLELVADLRDLKRNERVEVETLAREFLKVKTDLEEVRQKLDLN